MQFFISNPFIQLLFYLGALVTAITVHEFAHAYTADKLGDPTPQLQGRLTLNPKAHLDKYGSLIFVFLLIFRFPFVIGWGKPVQFDPFNLRNPRRDAALISLAGPMANLILATITAIFLRIFSPALVMMSFLTVFLDSLIVVNVVLAVFNLIPVHPLDGFKIVEGFLPKNQAIEWATLERYGYIFLMLLIFPIFSSTAPLQLLISPVINFLLNFLLPNIPIV